MSDGKDHMNYKAADFMNADFLKADFTKTGFMRADFMKDYQALAQQSWEAMAGQLKKPAPKDDFFSAVFPPDSTSSVTLEHALNGLKSYAEWMQGAAASVATPGGDWAQQVEQLFGQGRQPFATAFTGVDPGAPDFSRQWQAWVQSLQAGADATAPAAGPFATFGVDQEQQAEQQRLLGAINEHLEAAKRYQQLLQRSNERAIEKMRARLAPLAEPAVRIESLKMLYDVWVECSEEAHAEIALSDEFREAYAAMVNTQMRVRQLQQTQTEKLCQQLGIPTRSDVDDLGRRLHAFRREMRGGSAAAPNAQADEISQLRREVDELRALLARGTAAPRARKSAAGAAASKLAASPAVGEPVSKADVKPTAKTPAKKATHSAKVAAKASGVTATRKKK